MYKTKSILPETELGLPHNILFYDLLYFLND